MNTIQIVQTIEVSEKAMQVIALVRKAVEKSITGVSFVSIKNYQNKQGAVSNYLINVGVNYESTKQKDIDFLRNLDVTTLTEAKSSKLDLEKAKIKLIASFEKPNTNISNGQKNAYTHIANGLKVHNETGELYIYGYLVNKTVLKEGEKKVVNHKPETIVKKELEKLLKSNNFVNFAIEVGNELRAQGETIEL